MVQILDTVNREFRQVRQPLQHRGTGAAFNPAWKHFRTHAGTASLADATQHQAALRIHFPASNHEHAVSAGAQTFHRFFYPLVGHFCRRSNRHFALGTTTVVAPGHICRQHQRGYATEPCLTHGFSRITGNVVRCFGRVHPM